jgi:hypothetical protein
MTFPLTIILTFSQYTTVSLYPKHELKTLIISYNSNICLTNTRINKNLIMSYIKKLSQDLYYIELTLSNKMKYTIVNALIQMYTRMYTEVYGNIQGIHSYTPKIRFFQCNTSDKSPIINMSYKINQI